MQVKAHILIRFLLRHTYHILVLNSNNNSISLHNKEKNLSFQFNSLLGEIAIERGFVFTTIRIKLFDERVIKFKWVSWKCAKRFSSEFHYLFESWLKDKLTKVDTIVNLVNKDIQKLIEQQRYIKQSEVDSFVQKFELKMKQLDLLPEYIKIYRKEVYEFFEEKMIYDLIDKSNQAWIKKVSNHWDNWFQANHNISLNSSQLKSILVNDDINFVLAGAGSGKTTVLVGKLLYLLENKSYLEDEILCLTFGKDAAKEIQDRLKKRGFAKCKVQTFHSYALNIVNEVENNNRTLTEFISNQTQKRLWLQSKIYKLLENNHIFVKWKRYHSDFKIFGLCKFEKPQDIKSNTTLEYIWSRIMEIHNSDLSKKDIINKTLNNEKVHKEVLLFWPLYKQYLLYLKESAKLDFHTTIVDATKYIKKNKFQNIPKLLMVDEFQDISQIRLNLLMSILNTRKPISLFAVGDDWQSIFNFAGSRVSLMTNFQNLFPRTKLIRLNKTYRYNQFISTVSSKFITKNKNQLKKVTQSNDMNNSKSIFFTKNDNLENILIKLNNSYDKNIQNILFLGRTKKDKPHIISLLKDNLKNLKIKFMTCHESKGQEADYVFITNVDQGKFPLERNLATLNDYLNSESSEVNDEMEERRLFYVAITRAKKKVWVSYQTNPSKFYLELKKISDLKH